MLSRRFWRENADRRLSCALIGYQVLFFVFFFSATVTMPLPSLLPWLKKFFYLLFAVNYLSVLDILWQRMTKTMMNAVLLFSAVLTANFLFFPGNRAALLALLPAILTVCLPTFLIGLSIRDYSDLMDSLRKGSRIIFVLAVLLVIYRLAMQRPFYQKDYMSFSYAVLFPAILSADEFAEKHSGLALLQLILSCLMILFFGARGPLVCVFFFIFLVVLSGVRHRAVANYSMNLFLILTASLGLLFHREIFASIRAIAQATSGQAGRTLRTLGAESLLEGSVGVRIELYKQLLAGILERPLLGHGLAADRVMLQGYYAHNIVLELILAFGIPLAVLFLSFLVFRMIQSFNSKDEYLFRVTRIWLSLGFIHYMFSGSYLDGLEFWALMGLLLGGRQARGILPKQGHPLL